MGVTSLEMSVIAILTSGENPSTKTVRGAKAHQRSMLGYEYYASGGFSGILALSVFSEEAFGRVERRQSAFPCLCFLQRRAIASICPRGEELLLVSQLSLHDRGRARG